MGSAQSKVIKSGREKVHVLSLSPLQGLIRPLQHFPASLSEPLRLLWKGTQFAEPVQSGPGLRLPLAQQQIAVLKTTKRVESGILRLNFRLHCLGLAEAC